MPLVIHLEERELWDEKAQEFLTFPAQTIKLEHSLISLTKWEERWHEPLLGRAGEKPNRTEEQDISYIECMMITQNLPPRFYESLDASVIQKIFEYMNDPHTATTFPERPGSRKPTKKKTVTSELIYYWMIQAQIPFSCEKWHLSRLLTLIKVCDVKNAEQNPKKGKMSRSKLAAERRALNAQRKAQLNTTG